MNNVHSPGFIGFPDSKNLVVFIHGFMGGPRQFDRLAKSVSQNGFNAAILLLPGHGVSLKEFSSCTYRQWIEHVREKIDGFSQDYDNIWLVGHSMGGLLALDASVYPSTKLRGVFTIACPFEIKRLSKADIKVRFVQLFGKEDNIIKAEYINRSSVPRKPSVLFHSLAPMIEVKKFMYTTKSKLSKVCIPVKAIYSISDELVSINSLVILKSGLKKAPFEYAVLVESLHGYYTEEDKSSIEEMLLDFIRRG